MLAKALNQLTECLEINQKTKVYLLNEIGLTVFMSLLE
jgi:hypothetical protein